MCGIAGVIHADGKRPVSAGVLRAMGDAIAHRGPDGEGFFQAEGVGLVHRRLSIIDLSGGDQPMGNEDGSIQVVFNGEIYNFEKLREELESQGHRFRTRSDTEVLVHLYEEEGEDLVKRLRGMFAFAIWDGRRRRLLLGPRPDRPEAALRLPRRGETAVRLGDQGDPGPSGGRSRDRSVLRVEDYLAFGMIPGERSIFRKVRKLPPAHVTGRRAGTSWRHRRVRYWQFRVEPDHGRTAGEW